MICVDSYEDVKLQLFCILYFRLLMQHVARVLQWTLSQSVSRLGMSPVSLEYEQQLRVSVLLLCRHCAAFCKHFSPSKNDVILAI